MHAGKDDVFFNHPLILKLVDLAVEEDIGTGDITTRLTVDLELRGEGTLRSKEELVVAGLPLIPLIIGKYSAELLFETSLHDGISVSSGATVGKIRGPVRAMLSAERVILNFIQPLCGLAKRAREISDAVRGTGVKILDTRKTLPGWRLLEKYAVHLGGIKNHRYNLSDGILIKDNHKEACGGSISKAIKKVRESCPHTLKIEAETDNLNEAVEALEAGADIILLDNMNPREIEKAVRMIDGRAEVEISGGITPGDLQNYLMPGVNYISMGAVTQHIQPADISLDLEFVE